MAVGEVVADTLSKIQSKYHQLNSPEYDEYITGIYSKGAEIAHGVAKRKLEQVYEAVGFIPRVH